MENTHIASLLEEIADLLELQDANPFRIRSYRSAAQSIRNLADRVEDLAERGDNLSELPNIGESTAEKLHEILDRGTCQRLEALRDQLPAELPAIMQIHGIGPRKARQLHEELEIDSLDELRQVCQDHQVRQLKGMGARTEEKILKGIKTLESTTGRLLSHEAAAYLDSLAEYLDGLDEIKRWEVAGSFRRHKETIGDLDILILAGDRERITESLLRYAPIREVIGQGKEKLSVRLEGGPQVDFRFFTAAAFGAALLYFTGSKAHNIHLRRCAQENEWKLNEYGLFKGNHRLAGKTEEAVYQRLNLPWIPPELREDRGEVEAATEDALPDLIEPGDVRGDLHCHTTASDGRHSIREMAEAAQAQDFDYLAITNHSKRVTMAKGLDDEATRRHAEAIREAGRDLKRFTLLAGIEVDILKSGKLDLREKTLAGLDWVVASLHYDRAMGRRQMTDRLLAAVNTGVIDCLGHPLGRLLGKREPVPIDLDKLLEACAKHHVCLEINCQPQRLDLPDIYCRAAREAGVHLTLGTDAHSTDGFHFMRLGVHAARRGWMGKDDILNTRTVKQLRQRH